MEIENDSAAPNKTNQLWNVDTVEWESRDITTQPGENNRKYKVIAFIVNTYMNIIVNHFDI